MSNIEAKSTWVTLANGKEYSITVRTPWANEPCGYVAIFALWEVTDPKTVHLVRGAQQTFSMSRHVSEFGPTGKKVLAAIDDKEVLEALHAINAALSAQYGEHAGLMKLPALPVAKAEAEAVAAITATITRHDGTTETETFDSEKKALAFCREECKWESTARVVCPAIGFDQAGDYAGIFKAVNAENAPYSLTPEQVQAAIAGHDLSTYDGWTAAAQALLSGAPDWTAIKDGDSGYTVAVDGIAYAIAAEEGGDDAIYNEDLLVDFDRNAWDTELGGWEGEQAPASCLTTPVFVTLRHE